MAITGKTRKILWGRSGNRCAICKHLLQFEMDNSEGISVIGDECHIISSRKFGPRFDNKYQKNKADHYDNLILLCKIHHKVIDDHQNTFTKNLLYKIKNEHEEWVKLKLDPNDTNNLPIDIVFKNNITVYLNILTNTFENVVFPLHELENKIFVESYIPVELFFIHKEKLKGNPPREEIIVDENEKFKDTINSKLLLDIFKKRKRLLIVGSAGSGKSTLLKWMVVNCSKKSLSSSTNDITIPILIELKWFDGDLIELILEALNKNGLNCTRKTINDILFNEKILFLFDGLDEASRPHRCISQIKNIISKYRNAKSLITTRGVFLNKIFVEVGFDILEIRPLSNILINNFLRNIVGDDGTKKIIQELKKLELLNEIRNPLMLTFFAYEFMTNSNKLSNNTTLIFKNILENHFLYSWNIKNIAKEQEAELFVRDQIRFLSLIAYSMIEDSEDYCIDSCDVFGIDTKSKACKNYRFHNKEETVLSSLLSNNLLIKKGDKISFSHKSFQNYFASKHLLKLYESSSRSFISNFIDQKWEEAIIFLSGHLENPSNFISSLIVPWRKYLFRNAQKSSFRLRLAAKCIGRVRIFDCNSDIIVKQAIKIITIWHRDSKYRLKTLQTILFPIVFLTDIAFEVLSEIRSKEVANFLISYLNKRYDNDDYIDIYAVKALSAMQQNKASLEVISLTAVNHKDGVVRDQAKETLCDNISTVTVQILIGKLTDKDVEMKTMENVLYILKYVIIKLSESAVAAPNLIDIIISPLIDLAINSDNEDIRRRASFALCAYKLQDRIKKIVTPITQQIYLNPNPQIRANAILALRYPILDEAAPAIIYALDDENTTASKYAIHRSKYISYDPNQKRNAQKKLFSLIKSSKNEVIPGALNSFANLKDDLSNNEIKYIIFLLENSDTSVRFRAAEALGIHKAKEAKESLVKMINKEKFADPWSMAIWATINIDPQFYEIVKKNSWEETYIKELLTTSDEENRILATDVLARIGGIKSLNFLRKYEENNRHREGVNVPANIHVSINRLKERLKITDSKTDS